MKRYTWDDLYQMAIDASFRSYELNAKDEARSQLAHRIWVETGEDIEKAECPEDEIERYLNDSTFKNGTHVMFDERGNMQDPIVHGFEDVYVYVPNANQIVRIADGTGDNLLNEDRDEGYVDYLYFEQYDCKQNMPEGDGGMLMLKCHSWEVYDTLHDAVEDVLDLAYDSGEIEYVPLNPTRFE